MTQLIIPNPYRTYKGEEREIKRELDAKRPKLRTTWQYPRCVKCNKNVDSFKMERFQRDGIDYLALIVTCHGTTHTKEVPEYGVIQIVGENFFDDPKMYTNTPGGNRHRIRVKSDERP